MGATLTETSGRDRAATCDTLAATVSCLEDGFSTLLLADGRTMEVPNAYLHVDLRLEGMPVAISHDPDGRVTEIVKRDPRALHADLIRKIEEIRLWADGL